MKGTPTEGQGYQVNVHQNVCILYTNSQNHFVCVFFFFKKKIFGQAKPLKINSHRIFLLYISLSFQMYSWEMGKHHFLYTITYAMHVNRDTASTSQNGCVYLFSAAAFMRSHFTSAFVEPPEKYGFLICVDLSMRSPSVRMHKQPDFFPMKMKR